MRNIHENQFIYQILNLGLKLFKLIQCIHCPINLISEEVKDNIIKKDDRKMWEECLSEYIANIVEEVDGNVNVWWLPKDFSQSRLDRNTGSVLKSIFFFTFK